VAGVEPTPLRRHVELFNQGVRSGDFDPMLEPFTDDAELVFIGVPAGPFHGKEAIARAYREQPPDDEIEIGPERWDGEEHVARYRWLRGGEGELRLRDVNGRYNRLVVTFD
jgi:steroid delta-isomerase